MKQSAPQFALMGESTRRRPLRELITSIWECEPAVCSLDLLQISAWSNRRRPARGIAASVLVHIGVVCLAYSLPVHVVHRLNTTEPKINRSSVVYYNLTDIQFALAPRRVHSDSTKRNAGTSSAAPRVAAKRRPAQPSDSQMSVVSRPAAPDNSHQTILQAFPPELKIRENIPIPNLIMEVPAPRFAPPVIPRPQPVPPPPVERAAAAVIPVTPAAIAVAQPSLAVPPPAAVNPEPRPDVAPAAAQAQSTASELASDAAVKNSLTTLTVDPVPLSNLIALPPGNKLGSFEISLASPPDRPGGTGSSVSSQTGNGEEKGTRAAEGSLEPGGNSAGTGAGSGAGGDGHGDPENGGVGFIHTGSGNGSTAGAGLAGPAAALVYPVQPPPPRAPGLIVSAGSGGGGALRTYGVLHGQRIYSIYLPMPGADWILQYCERGGERAVTPQGGVIRLGVDKPLAPPLPLEQFDFRRNGTVGAAPDRQIMLQGSITEEGTVRDLRVLKGVEDSFDRAALEAFGRWKFKPATKADAPVALDIVVGIPVHAMRN